ncbi:hypothetical protein LTR62_007185 [Meristemomyces frigidus]|uniref:Uncharacterized protein n=1 Tax=Meristemomyces frigidus TaxID=1508187 RepID=A0AAN7TES5_9PEZI|nr:hypothetical protein LTR62_007185 [Meristemomyces frigidus]
MSLKQTYYIASTAKSKLGREAKRKDYDLRLLVGHADLLEALTLDLPDAEWRQGAWFTQSVEDRTETERLTYIHWEEPIPKQEEEKRDDESDAGFRLRRRCRRDLQDSGLHVRIAASLDRVIPVVELDESSNKDEDNDEQHAPMRVPSWSHAPLEFMDDRSEGEGDNESMPSSRETQPFERYEKQRQAMTSLLRRKCTTSS